MQKSSKRAFVFAWLAPGDSTLHYADCNENKELLGEPLSLALASVTSIVTGRKCTHLRHSRYV